jgi:hypothetical protein
VILTSKIEMGVLVDAIGWELEMFARMSGSPRHEMLRDLQERLQKAIDETDD